MQVDHKEVFLLGKDSLTQLEKKKTKNQKELVNMLKRNEQNKNRSVRFSTLGILSNWSYENLN